MPETLRRLADWRVTRGNALALSDGRCTLSYGELAARVAGFAAAADFPAVVGVLADNCVAWAIADLGLGAAGRTLVPLPAGFTDAQLGHVIRDANVGLVLHDAGHAEVARRLGVVCRRLDSVTDRSATDLPPTRVTDPGQVNRIIYTSGTTGAPKGVRIGPAQLDFMTLALTQATAACDGDRYMSVLPLALLLEQLAAVHVPVYVGGESHLVSSVASAAARGLAGDVAAAAKDVRPTVCVLVPALLRVWMAGLAEDGAPETLRHVAVGGAHVAPRLASMAWSAGIPVHEGYGLSECTSVVALNRPGERAPGTVGRPLDGLTVSIAADDEIVVAGPSVMQGYLGKDQANGIWRTGDLGRLTPSGNLIVHGRRDTVLVTPYGRNVSPEWIESMLTADPRVAQAQLMVDPERGLVALLGLTEGGVRWSREASADSATNLAAIACDDAPEYARPNAVFAVPAERLIAAGVIRPDGQIDRDLGQAFMGRAASSKILNSSNAQEGS